MRIFSALRGSEIWNVDSILLRIAVERCTVRRHQRLIKTSFHEYGSEQLVQSDFAASILDSVWCSTTQEMISIQNFGQ